MTASAQATAAALALRAGMHALVCLPARYIAGRMMLARGLVLGLQMTLVEPSANPLATLAAGTAIDFAAFVPLQVQTLLESGEQARLDAMHAILVGGGPISATLAAAIAPLRAPVYHTYGMTETATHIALRRLSGPQRNDNFTPLPGVTLRLDGRGCLAIRGPMTDGAWVQTNDLAALQADGSFAWLGRADNVVNSGGVKVHIEPLEATLERLLPTLLGAAWDGRRFIVAGLADARLGETVAIILEGSPLPAAQANALLGGLRQRLSPFEAPRRILYAARFAETETGKIDRAATRAQAQQEQPKGD
jgi:O-succinylbenzoic acid--CoA ligase